MGEIMQGEKIFAMADLSMTERAVLNAFRRNHRDGRGMHIDDLKRVTGCSHSAHLPGIMVSLIRKGYIRDDMPSAPRPPRAPIARRVHVTAFANVTVVRGGKWLTT